MSSAVMKHTRLLRLLISSSRRLKDQTRQEIRAVGDGQHDGQINAEIETSPQVTRIFVLDKIKYKCLSLVKIERQNPQESCREDSNDPVPTRAGEDINTRCLSSK